MLVLENFLAPGEYLIYVPNKHSFADAEGYTHIARKVRDYIQGDTVWYDFLLVTDGDGNRLSTPVAIIVPANRIVSDRPTHDIELREIYHFTSSSDLDDSSITARSFVIKSNLTDPLISTSRSALGSGIYGLYSSNPSNVSTLRSDSNQEIYKIELSNPYLIQDKEHGESLTIASLNTNAYLDRMLEPLRNEFVDDSFFDTVLTQIKLNNNPALFTLWNIVFYRTRDFLSQDVLDSLLAEYLVEYLISDNFVDTISGEPVYELPINLILRSLGYDGVIASDPYNNGWDRGCVSYDYDLAGIIEGEKARY